MAAFEGVEVIQKVKLRLNSAKPSLEHLTFFFYLFLKFELFGLGVFFAFKVPPFISFDALFSCNAICFA